MVSTYTPNIDLEEPARGDQVGTWDTPVNANMTLLDLVVGGTVTVPIAGAPIVLAAAQFQCKTIVFNSTLTASITITFPTSFTKSYEIFHQATGSSNFTITLQTTAAGGQVICCPPGEISEIANIGSNMFFRNLGRVGQYWDHAGSSVPNWVSGCTVPPYLNCTGATFSSATYPQLATILGSTTLPDSKGRTRFTLDQAAGRISSAGTTGFSGSSVGSGGGVQTTTIGTSNLPAYTPTGTVATTYPVRRLDAVGGGGTHTDLTTLSLGNDANATAGSLAGTSPFTGDAQGGSATVLTNLSPGYIGGITMIRSA